MPLGESNDQWVEILDGLAENEQVMLSDAGQSRRRRRRPDAAFNLREGGGGLQPR